MGGEEAEKQMTKRIEVAQAPAPLEAYAKHFDPRFSKSNQREGRIGGWRGTALAALFPPPSSEPDVKALASSVLPEDVYFHPR